MPAPALNYRALLIGVSDYPELDRRWALEGPKNDVARMRQLLLDRGFAAGNIRVLADGLPNAVLPTRTAILEALEHLAETAASNDYIVIQLSGHGSQQPVPLDHPALANEPDGLFEVFLPRDVSGWSNRQAGIEGQIRNAIIDYEIREQVDRMVARGAFVWGLMDACHAATLVRGPADDEVRSRQIPPLELGISQLMLDDAQARASSGRPRLLPREADRRASRLGGSVFFYAAQTTEAAQEMRLPADDPARRSHGLLSFTVMQALEGGATMSFQQLAQQVLMRYAAMPNARATPIFAGTALQAGVFGQAHLTARQWSLARADRLTLEAGSLAGLEAGAVLAVLPTPLSAIDDALGYVSVAEAGAMTSSLVPISHEGRRAVTPEALHKGRVARLVAPAFRFGFVVGIDLEACAEPCPFQPVVDLFRPAPASAEGLGVDIRWVGPRESAHLRLVADGSRLWLLPPGMPLSNLKCLTEEGARERCRDRLERRFLFLDASTADASIARLTGQMHTMLQAAGRASRLMRIAAGLASSGADKLAVSVSREPAAGSGEPASPVVAFQSSRMQNQDVVRITLENTGALPLDATILYLDSRFGITAIHPLQGAVNRIEPRATLTTGLVIEDRTLGLERLLVIAVTARRLDERADFSFLADGAAGGTRAAGGFFDPGQFLGNAGFDPPGTRSGARRPVPRQITIQTYTWQVEP